MTLLHSAGFGPCSIASFVSTLYLSRQPIVKFPLCAWWLTGWERHRWTTVVNVKLLLPPRQSRGASLSRLGSTARRKLRSGAPNTDPI
jgi:hypothetical protein